MSERKRIIAYSEAFNGGAKAVGNKAFNTALCHQSGFLVPDGIIIPGDVFLSYQKAEDIDDVFKAVENHFQNSRLLIVRSSSLDEDRASASFAGQYLSVICENTAADIRKAAQACWHSFDSPPVRAYRKAVTGREDAASQVMPLLIQKVIRSDCAGVCFSNDPQKTAEDGIVINAVRGLGETLVNGEVAADHYEYEMKSRSVVKAFTGRQTLWRAFDRPGVLSPLPESLINQPVLNQRQIQDIAELAEAISHEYRRPMDIEWAFEGESLYLLQARPVTVDRHGSSYQRWTRDNVADVIPDAVTPLTWSLVSRATNDGFVDALRRMGFSSAKTRLFDLFNGRAYFNAAAFQDILTQASVSKRHLTDVLKKAIRHVFLLVVLPVKIHALGLTFAKRLSACRSEEPGAALKRIKAYLDELMSLHILIAVLMQLEISIIRALGRGRWENLRRGEGLDRLVSGLKATESTAASEALRRLGGKINKDISLTREILSRPDDDIDEILSAHKNDFKSLWHDFFRLYGHQSLKEFEIYYPRWSEDRTFPTAMLKQYLRQRTTDFFQPAKTSNRKKWKNEIKRVAKTFPLLLRIILLFYLYHVRLCSRWREAVKQKLVKIMAEARSQAMNFSQGAGLSQAQDVFFLTLDQILAIENRSPGQGWNMEIEKNKALWLCQNAQAAFHEIRIYENGRQVWIPHFARPDRDRLQGIGMSGGQYTGTARVILNSEQIVGFEKGDVLVLRSTNPSWTPLFALAGAIVADMGNYLSHGAIIARELGIPAVGNLFSATETIRDEEVVFVDGDEGWVRILEGRDSGLPGERTPAGAQASGTGGHGRES